MIDSALSIKNASGKTFSLLNDTSSSQSSDNNKLTAPTSATTPKRKYHCNEPGCNKSFTTSGHLARHHRIHTGEKNFHCLHPGCPSRFSRQDNMMQHYRTHLSQKVRRQQARHSNKQQQKKEASPELYRHSYYGPEDRLSFQPLVVTRPRRSATMPSSTTMPYYPMINRPRRRALSTSSSTSASSSSSFTLSPSHAYYNDDYCYQKQVPIILPPLPLSTMVQQEDWNNHRKQQQQQQQPQQHFSNLLHLANIVSTFG